MDWQDLLTAVCLVLVLEGMMPFLNPAGWRSMLEALGEVSDKQLRIIGFSSMMLGVVLLFWVKQA